MSDQGSGGADAKGTAAMRGFDEGSAAAAEPAAAPAKPGGVSPTIMDDDPLGNEPAPWQRPGATQPGEPPLLDPKSPFVAPASPPFASAPAPVAAYAPAPAAYAAPPAGYGPPPAAMPPTPYGVAPGYAPMPAQPARQRGGSGMIIALLGVLLLGAGGVIAFLMLRPADSSSDPPISLSGAGATTIAPLATAPVATVAATPTATEITPAPTSAKVALKTTPHSSASATGTGSPPPASTGTTPPVASGGPPKPTGTATSTATTPAGTGTVPPPPGRPPRMKLPSSTK